MNIGIQTMTIQTTIMIITFVENVDSVNVILEFNQLIIYLLIVSYYLLHGDHLNVWTFDCQQFKCIPTGSCKYFLMISEPVELKFLTLK